MEVTLWTSGRRSEVRGGKSEYGQTGAQSNQQQGGMNGERFILNPHLSALNYFLALEYLLREYISLSYKIPKGLPHP